MSAQITPRCLVLFRTRISTSSSTDIYFLSFSSFILHDSNFSFVKQEYVYLLWLYRRCNYNLMKTDRIANFSCIWLERRTEIVNFSSRKKSGLDGYNTFETFQLSFYHLYYDVVCYGMVLYGVLCNIKIEKWKVISEERAKKKEIAYFNNVKM